jgi:hypothetical protein
MDGDVEQAIPIDRAVLKKSPNFVPGLYSMAGSLWMSGQAREALHHLDLAIERDPFDSLLRVYRAKILYSLGDYQGVHDTAQSCPEPCANIGNVWLLAMASQATEAEYRRDFPALEQRALASGWTAEDLVEARAVVEAFIFRRPITLPPMDDDRVPEFIDAVIDGRLISFERGLRLARIAAGHQHADSVLDILNDGRVTFTREQRADPRYHELFRHPKLSQIADARRNRGVLAGLPVFPVKRYTGR